MDYEQRELLANEFAGVIRHVREESWAAFCSASEEIELEPYASLGRLFVRIVEDTIEGKSKSKPKPKSKSKPSPAKKRTRDKQP